VLGYVYPGQVAPAVYPFIGTPTPPTPPIADGGAGFARKRKKRFEPVFLKPDPAPFAGRATDTVPGEPVVTVSLAARTAATAAVRKKDEIDLLAAFLHDMED
jgi:hypothetical protein